MKTNLATSTSVPEHPRKSLSAGGETPDNMTKDSSGLGLMLLQFAELTDSLGEHYIFYPTHEAIYFKVH
ncbi:hypothetical protein [Hymenobacter mucosus]|uniref:Uncharacterized protein n=1 Tax=Hymenobacter mucosus TaxID=1411120 RepID=A0A239B8L3_9BACT|nr:hypothetical protein [Hymenobacter mucosus]SNS03483.1 hypothetical protein SAMN06269173_1197 [Hymenobacter mucosus]